MGDGELPPPPNDEAGEKPPHDPGDWHGVEPLDEVVPLGVPDSRTCRARERKARRWAVRRLGSAGSEGGGHVTTMGPLGRGRAARRRSAPPTKPSL